MSAESTRLGIPVVIGERLTGYDHLITGIPRRVDSALIPEHK